MIYLYITITCIFLSFLCIHFYQRIKRDKESISNKNDHFSEKNATPFKPTNTQRKFKSVLQEYIAGYVRLIDIIVGYIPSHRIRNFIYKYIFLLDLGEKTVIYYGAEIRAHYNVHIGKGSIIGDKVVLDGRRGGIYIGNNVNFSSFVHLWTGQHDYKDPYFRSMPGRRGPIKIGNRAWIGPNVTILHSVEIGEGAVIAAGAVVTKDIPPFTLAGGIPAKVIGERPRNLKYEFSGNHSHFL